MNYPTFCARLTSHVASCVCDLNPLVILYLYYSIVQHHLRYDKVDLVNCWLNYYVAPQGALYWLDKVIKSLLVIFKLHRYQARQSLFFRFSLGPVADAVVRLSPRITSLVSIETHECWILMHKIPESLGLVSICPSATWSIQQTLFL